MQKTTMPTTATNARVTIASTTKGSLSQDRITIVLPNGRTITIGIAETAEAGITGHMTVIQESDYWTVPAYLVDATF